ncbi:MAG: DMT family transporter [Deltaproteobacteria bacterium]|nr:DMT family transporter [Deltaproteobacteria bacterium]
MTLTLAAAVLFAALLHALWNSFVKLGADRLANVVVIAATGALLSLPVALWVPLPSATALPLLAGSVMTHVVYYYCLINAYRFGDLSRVYPLARGLAPPLVAISAALVAGEAPTLHEALGVALVSIGIASLVLAPGGVGGGDARRGLGFALATGAMIATYTVLDGLGGRRVANPLSYIAWLNIGEAVGLLAVAAWRRGAALGPAMRADLRRAVIAGVMATVAYAIVIAAMSRGGAMAQVSALRETSVVIAALIGTLLLGEPGRARRVTAAVIVAAGAAVMHL